MLPSMNALAALLLAVLLSVPGAAAGSTSAGAGPPPDAVPASGSGSSRPPAPARAVWPLEPRPDVVSGFDPPVSRWGAGHRGADLRGTVGEPVRAAEAGTVRFVGTVAGRGVVVVDHGGTRTTYEPVAGTVSVGERVGAGTVLGTLELAGSHCFPAACLHWGLIEGRSTYRNPLALVGGGPVRLLPMEGPAHARGWAWR